MPHAAPTPTEETSAPLQVLQITSSNLMNEYSQVIALTPISREYIRPLRSPARSKLKFAKKRHLADGRSQAVPGSRCGDSFRKLTDVFVASSSPRERYGVPAGLLSSEQDEKGSTTPPSIITVGGVGEALALSLYLAGSLRLACSESMERLDRPIKIYTPAGRAARVYYFEKWIFEASSSLTRCEYAFRKYVCTYVCVHALVRHHLSRRGKVSE